MKRRAAGIIISQMTGLRLNFTAAVSIIRAFSVMKSMDAANSNNGRKTALRRKLFYAEHADQN